MFLFLVVGRRGHFQFLGIEFFFHWVFLRKGVPAFNEILKQILQDVDVLEHDRVVVLDVVPNKSRGGSQWHSLWQQLIC